MKLSSCCQECTCWFVFAFSSVILMVMVSLAFHDFTVIAQTEGAISLIINTPTSQLGCREVCQIWYSFQSDHQCCDRYNSALCVSKLTCRNKYIADEKVAIEILQNDLASQMATAGFCLIIIVVITLIKFKSGRNDGYSSGGKEEELKKMMIDLMLKAKGTQEKGDGEGQVQTERALKDFLPQRDGSQLQSPANEKVVLIDLKNLKPRCQCIQNFIKYHQCDSNPENHFGALKS